MPTITEIANHAGVSRTAAWLAVNQKKGVSEAMRQRVLSARDDLEVQNGERKNRHERRTKSVLVSHSALVMSTEYLKRILAGIQLAADRFQIQLRVVAIEPNQPPEHAANLYFSDSGLHPDGVISLGSGIDRHMEFKARQIDVPFVQVGVPVDLTTPYVAPNELAAGELAAGHLLAMGHRAIGFIGHQKEAPHLQQRLAGYREALMAHHVQPQTGWEFVIESNHTSYGQEVQMLEAVVNRFIAKKPPVTALLFANSQSAVTALPRMIEAGYRIPDDLSVVVFDNFEHEATFDVPLTAIDYPLEEMGFGAVKLMIEQIKEPLLERGHYIYRAQLIERESCLSLLPMEIA